VVAPSATDRGTPILPSARAVQRTVSRGASAGASAGAQPAGAPQAAPASQQATPRASAPAPLGPSGHVNEWLSLRGEFRGRLEGFSGGAYRPDNSDGYMLNRFRINFTVAPSVAYLKSC
jgi:hypothetical protein